MTAEFFFIFIFHVKTCKPKELMRILFFLLSTLFCTEIFSQIAFEKGYFLTNDNDSTICLIKNKDWQYTPNNFEYKSNLEGDVKSTSLHEIQEFGIFGKSKFIRKTVLIDRSSDLLNKISDVKKPLFEEEILFLNVLLEGNASLAIYEDEEITRFFYSVNDIEMEQLVFKRYMLLPTIVARNNNFRHQLFMNLKCEGSNIEKKVVNAYYSRNELIDLFTTYNECSGSNQISYGDNRDKDLFNLSIKPRYRTLSLVISNPNDIAGFVNFGSTAGFSLGLETEFILPFKKNKWAIVAEPNYLEFLSSTNVPANLVGGSIDVELDYKSIELPVGLRYYLFLGDQSKIFLNALYTVDFDFNSKIIFTRVSGENFDTFDIQARPNLCYGIGYKYGKRISAEFRTMTPRTLLGYDKSWDSVLNSMSLILGISLF